MKVFFEQIEGNYIKKFFPIFFHEDSIFFEIISNSVPIGFYGIKTISEKICEISVFFNFKDRNKITKSVAIKCLSFPFLLGFCKILIRTELEKVHRFLCSMKKHKVNYLFKHNKNYLFEVLI